MTPDDFWSKVDRTGECWLWMGALRPQGHGEMWVKGRRVSPRKFAWELLRGPLDARDALFSLCHLADQSCDTDCDHRRCVNPDHMRVRPARVTEEMIWARVNRRSADECWLWLGVTDCAGYGRANFNAGRHIAHRLIYEFSGGSIPAGHELDHLCRTPSCVNPKHLEPVTPEENRRREVEALREDARLRQTCRHGHLMTPENTYVPPNRPTWRICRACRRRHHAASSKKSRSRR